MNEEEKQQFQEVADQDNKFYEPELHNYVPTGEGVTESCRHKWQKKDPNAPQKWLSAFLWFCNDQRSKVKAEYPEYAMDDIAKELDRRWADAEPQVKAKYELLSEQDKVRYEMEMTLYKKLPLMHQQTTHMQEDEDVEEGYCEYDVEEVYEYH